MHGVIDVVQPVFVGKLPALRRLDAGAIPVSHPGISGFVHQGMHHDHLAVEGAGLAGLVTTFGKSRAIWATTTPTVRWPGAWFTGRRTWPPCTLLPNRMRAWSCRKPGS